MSTIADLNPDVALAALLDGKVKVQTSATQSHTIRAYADGKQPEKGLAGEFISIQWNGGARSRSTRLGIYQGALALTIRCELLNSTRDGQTVNTSRIRKILWQVQLLVHRKTSQGIFFKFSPMNVIMPTVPDRNTGYSQTMLNVDWRTTTDKLST